MKHKGHHHPAHEQEEQTASSFADMADALGTEAADKPQSVEELTTALDTATKKADEFYDKFMRTQAEMANLRTRTLRDVENAHKFALEKFVKELLPVLDSVEQGLAVSNDDHETMKAMREGLELTYKMLLSVLQKFGVTQLNPQDEPYDPHQHEAMSMVDIPGVAPNTVVQVVQKGYQLHGRLVRPARVIISKP